MIGDASGRAPEGCASRTCQQEIVKALSYHNIYIFSVEGLPQEELSTSWQHEVPTVYLSPPGGACVALATIRLHRDGAGTDHAASPTVTVTRFPIYARVSTVDQSCERQIGELTAFAERSGFEVFGIFQETASGARNSRLVRNRGEYLPLALKRHATSRIETSADRFEVLTPEFSGEALGRDLPGARCRPSAPSVERCRRNFRDGRFRLGERGLEYPKSG